MRMKQLQLVSAVSVGVLALVAFGGQARASSITFSSMEIDNFALSFTGGTPSLTQLPNNSSNASASQSGSGGSVDGVNGSTTADVGLQCVGNCVGIGQNQMTKTLPLLNQVFTRGDSGVLQPGGIGTPITGLAVVESQLVGTIANASASGAAGTTSQFAFSGTTNVTMSFSAILDMLAEVIVPGGTSHAFASWTAELDRVNSNGTTTKLATFVPNGNALSDLVITADGTGDGLTSGGVTGDGCSLQVNALGATQGGQTNPYNCTSGFGATIDGLLASNTYQLVIGQQVSLNSSSIPEPKTLGMLAVGLLGVGFFMRRKQRQA